MGCPLSCSQNVQVRVFVHVCVCEELKPVSCTGNYTYICEELKPVSYNYIHICEELKSVSYNYIYICEEL